MWYNICIQEKCEKVLKNINFLNIQNLHSNRPTTQADGRCIYKK